MYMYHNNMRDSGLPLFVSLFPYSSHNPLPDMWLRNACSGQCPRCDAVLHELRDLAKVTRKSSAKTYTCQKSLAPAEGQILVTLYMEISGVYSGYHT
jgi:hypothetical protein